MSIDSWYADLILKKEKNVKISTNDNFLKKSGDDEIWNISQVHVTGWEYKDKSEVRFK